MSTVNRLYRRRIGEILVAHGVISSEQLEEALVIQKKTGELLGVILLDLGLVTESDIAKTICVQYQLPFLALNNYELNGKLVKLFPPEFLITNKLLPFDRIGDTLLIMITEIPSEDVIAEIPKLTKLNAALYIGYPSEVDRFLGKFLGISAPGQTQKAGVPEGAVVSASGARAASPPAAGSPGGGRPPASRPQPAPQVKQESPVSLEEEEEEVVYDLSDADDEYTSEAVETQEEQVAEQAEEPEREREAAEAKAPLVFGGSGKSFLQELDSTWDSIFPGADSEDSKKSSK